MINSKGKEFIPAKYDALSLIDSLGIFYLNLNDKYGLVDKNGKEITPLIYDNLEYSKNLNKVFVKSNGKWGYLSDNYKTFTPVKFTQDKFYFFSKDTALVKDDSGCYLVKNPLEI